MNFSLETRLLGMLRHSLFVDAGDYRNTVILAGTGRSGTTWVENIINANGEYRVMFEPFYSGKIPLVGGWRYRQYLRPDDQRERYLRPAERILSGKIRNTWIDRYNRKIFAKKRLVKDIRIMLVLKWMKTHFPEIPIVLLLRHPCAVAVSKLKLNWQTHLDEFLGQEALVDDFLEPYIPLLQRSRDVFEQHLFLWCVENYVPLRQFDKGEILVVFYENVCVDPASQIRRLYEFLGLSGANDCRDEVSRPSALSRRDSAIYTGESLIDGWRHSLTKDQIIRATEICGLFGLDRVYAEDSRPLVDADSVLSMF